MKTCKHYFMHPLGIKNSIMPQNRGSITNKFIHCALLMGEFLNAENIKHFLPINNKFQYE
jgi:hypothetical protein